LSLKTISAIIITVFLFSCSPRVEDVRYTEYSARFKNDLMIQVNTFKGLFKGRESFLHFKRVTYLFLFETRGQSYTEKDIEIGTLGGPEIRIKPSKATVEILPDPEGGIIVAVNVNDERIPRLVNGRYRLQVGSKGPVSWLKGPSVTAVWHRMK